MCYYPTPQFTWLVPMPAEVISSLTVMRPFDSFTWAALLAAMIASSALVQLFNILALPRMSRILPAASSSKISKSDVLLVALAPIQEAPPSIVYNFKNDSVRAFGLMTWIFMAFILSLAYKSALLAMLATKQ